MRLAAVACCLLLVVAGCQGLPADSAETREPASTVQSTSPTKTAEPSTESTRSPDTSSRTTGSPRTISVEGGSLPYDPDGVWARVESMRGVDVGKPLTVRLESISGSLASDPPPFDRALGVEAPPEPLLGRGVTPNVADGNVVKLNADRIDTRVALEGTLAHEYVHVVQMRNRVPESLWASFGDSPTLDDRFAYRAVLEGSADYVETRYRRQYLPDSSGAIEDRYRNAATTAKRVLAPYYFGARYVNATVESPTDLDAVYESPPQTTEELIHRLPPGSEQPAALDVSVATDVEHTNRRQFGELFVRSLFGTGLNESAAAELADGWGNDRQLEFEGTNSTGFAWVLRWDDAANATEFENGVATYLEQTDTPGPVRVDRVAPETTVLFAGDESFVQNATASGGNSTVTVTAQM